MIIKFKHLVFVVLLLVAVGGYAQETMMNVVDYAYLEKLIEVAKTNYPKMKMYHHKLEQAKTNITKNKLSWFNIFTLSYLYNPNTNSTTNTTSTSTSVNPLYSYQFAFSANLGTLATTGPSVRMAKQDYEIAKDNIDEYNLNIEAEVKTRYFTYIRQNVVLSIKAKNASEAESIKNQVKDKFERGEETYENYNRAVANFNTALQNKIDGESELLIAKGNLEEILGEKLAEIE